MTVGISPEEFILAKIFIQALPQKCVLLCHFKNLRGEKQSLFRDKEIRGNRIIMKWRIWVKDDKLKD